LLCLDRWAKMTAPNMLHRRSSIRDKSFDDNPKAFIPQALFE
jgi:hypothetical protein